MSLQRSVCLGPRTLVDRPVPDRHGRKQPKLRASASSAGKASDEAKKPYTDYTVQLRDVSTGQRASTVPLGIDGRFSFSGVTLTKKYLVELYQVKQNKIVCTAGRTLSTPALISKTDVNINCGTNSAVRWLAVAGAGTAIAVALGVRSAKQ